jgi:SAM-dependent methyltransferase
VNSKDRSYDDLYRDFNSPLSQRLRQEAYGSDIGQHSWVRAEELDADISLLKLTKASRLLDLGCGPGGPLTHLISKVGCRGTGADVSPPAIAAGRERAASMRLEERLTFHEADLNAPLPFPSGSFDAVMSLDVILHLRDRLAVFREVARVLTPTERFLFTDAGVITGAISDEEIRSRVAHGFTQFVPPGFNERMLELSGFRLIESCDLSTNLLKAATGRLAARLAHRQEVEEFEGRSYFEEQNRYLETVIALSLRGAVSRFRYIAESTVAR